MPAGCRRCFYNNLLMDTLMSTACMTPLVVAGRAMHRTECAFVGSPQAVAGTGASAAGTTPYWVPVLHSINTTCSTSS